MPTKPDQQPTATDTTDAKEAPPGEASSSEAPPTKDPQKAAGSINPREKAPFYEAVVQKGKRKKTW